MLAADLAKNKRSPEATAAAATDAARIAAIQRE